MSRRKKGPGTILSALEEQPKKCGSKTSASETIPAAAPATAPAVDEKNAAKDTPVEDVKAFTMPESTPTEPEQPAVKEDTVTTVHIQSLLGGDIELDTIISRVRDAAPVSEDLTIYVKAEENKAYFTTGEESGSVDLW
jgi:predicted component of type VI protein secretion system